MRICVIGAGGLGAYVGAVLMEQGHSVQLMARGLHLDAMRSQGLHILEDRGERTLRPECIGPDEVPREADAAFVSVKAHGLAEAAGPILEVARRGATVVSLLNGVETEDRLAEMGVPHEHIAHGVAYLTAFLESPGVVRRHGSHGRILLGPGNRGSGRLQELAAAFTGSAIEAVVAPRIDVELWKKWTVVCALSAVCGLVPGALGEIRRHPSGAVFQRRAVEEVLEVGRHRGIELPHALTEDILALIGALPDGFYPSLVHDLRSGHPTEVDALCGAVGRLGRMVGIPTPIHDLVTLAVELRTGTPKGGSD